MGVCKNCPQSFRTRIFATDNCFSAPVEEARLVYESRTARVVESLGVRAVKPKNLSDDAILVLDLGVKAGCARQDDSWLSSLSFGWDPSSYRN